MKGMQGMKGDPRNFSYEFLMGTFWGALHSLHSLHRPRKLALRATPEGAIRPQEKPTNGRSEAALRAAHPSIRALEKPCPAAELRARPYLVDRQRNWKSSSKPVPDLVAVPSAHDRSQEAR
jgi:hypothetical protein